MLSGPVFPFYITSVQVIELPKGCLTLFSLFATALSSLLMLQRVLRRQVNHEILTQGGGNPSQQEKREDLESLHFRG